MPQPILLAFGVSARMRGRLEALYEVHGPVGGVRPETVPPEARHARALITIGGHRTDAALMDALPDLGLIACYGTGYEGVDLAAAKARGIQVTHAKDANATSVAEFAMGLVIAASRDMTKGERMLRAGEWPNRKAERMPLVPGLAGQRMGIYGLGAIGMRVATRAAAFEMEVGYHGRSPREGIAYGYHPTLRGLAEWCDVLVVAVRATAANRHAVDREVLAALGKHGVLVNVARGLVVDEAALTEALEHGVIAAAGLDVFEHEPHVPERLRALPNAVLTPHMAAFTLSAQRAQAQVMLDALEDFFAGRAPANLVAEMA
ncbi:2-hydroxyacid dehydrogenase [Neoroseomonas oryzicola]|uniref:2-hydroxyacid dehydrogenase n=1 Tax=Neoroseomonas oryzicola TaxID=535904 RepID=A0A9X9WC64_9PROT|nr:2-hydroxyacid dehydrogenase [Neoroseomonas oryzicola]MBR0657924.1 2-hydroxyacid dehydrogenase [Neoroseomonas oryzicola]NKE18758.1 2-hydroxyacid dehydrogenase [Neoroseomonas oryzicola]